MRRFDILEGDHTDVGGVVQRGLASDTLNGRAQAYEHDPVWCPTCNTMGKIRCIGPRISMKGSDGREAALSDDLYLCLCTPSHRLLASQSASYVDA